jgi:hypothetical protein
MDAGKTATVDRPPMSTIALGADEPVTTEEIERRRALFARTIALREEIGPIGLSADELVRRARDEANGCDG